jgi:hypothetical protein
MSKDALLAHIKAVHAKSKQEYGWPRAWRDLVSSGILVGKERVRLLMKLHGINATAGDSPGSKGIDRRGRISDTVRGGESPNDADDRRTS